MSKASLIGLGGIAAIVAGILRGVASFIPDITSDVARSSVRSHAAKNRASKPLI
jgi:hypothetical protein